MLFSSGKWSKKDRASVGRFDVGALSRVAHYFCCLIVNCRGAFSRRNSSNERRTSRTASLVWLRVRSKWRTKWWLWCLLWCWFCVVPGVVHGLTEFRGQVVRDLKTLALADSPFLVTGNVVVEREGELRIEPGVELKFLPGVGMTVRGTLKAEGLESRVIRFTRSSEKTSPDFQIPTDIRLVDGPSIHEGRLQLFYKGKWRSVCTNSRNWTRTDLEVACRQLGFRGGSLSRWYPRNNDSSQMSYERPSCPEGTSSLSSCSWTSTRMGSGVCDLHYDLGIHCEPQSALSLQHWSGLRFDEAPFFVYDGQKVSLSSLRHLEILYAGWNATDGNLTSALESYGVPPVVQRVSVKWSAYTGINATLPGAPVEITDCLITANRGYGIYVNTSTGLVRVSNSTVLANGGDGVRYVFHDAVAPPYDADPRDFCDLLDRGASQTYPLSLVAVQEKSTSANVASCEKVFSVDRSAQRQQLTLHLVYAESSSPDGGGQVEVRDGPYPQSPLLARIVLRNDSRAQSVSSTGGALWVKFSPAAGTYVLVAMEVVAQPDKAFDLNLTTTTVKENNGRGIAVENMRSMLHVVSSTVLTNGYLAGIHVADGAGDVNLTRTTVSENAGDGVNVSYAGGRRNLTACNVMRNAGRGFALWLNESSHHQAADQYTVVAYSSIVANEGIGVLIGNFCRPSVINVTYTTVQEGRDAGVVVETCWRQPDDGRPPPLRLSVTLSRFLRQEKPALIVRPAVSVEAFIAHNHFLENRRGALLLRNPPDVEELEMLPAVIDVRDNVLEGNRGSYVVAIGLSQFSLVQSLDFHRNELRKNKVTEPFPSLSPRHRVAAVVTVSSSNVRIHRNLFENQGYSTYDIGSQLPDHYAAIDATLCYFGKFQESEALKVYDRVFDSKDRYDLASILVTPYLLVPYKEEDRLISTNQSNQLVVDFRPNADAFRLGGTVYGRQELAEGTYSVWRDIYVRANSELVLTRKTTLKFAPSVGVMVQGKLTVRGERADPAEQVLMTADEAPSSSGTASSDVPLRLVGGTSSGGDVVDGLLQVRVGERWGTVCNYGWNRYGAALTCAAMGLVWKPGDWLVTRGQLVAAEDRAGGDELPILLSNVRCTEDDVELLACRAEGVDDFERSCTHDDDVGLRCYRPTWAGVRLGLMAEPSSMVGMRVERAGVLDPVLGAFRPALQIDLNRHRLEQVTVARNLDSGLGVLFNDFYADANARRLTGAALEENLAHGLVTRSSGLTLHASRVRANRHHGVLYDPSLDHWEQRELCQWVDRSSSQVVVLVPGVRSQSRGLDRGASVYVVMDSRTPSAGTVVEIRLTTTSDNVFGLQILSQVHNGTNQSVIVFDGTADAPSPRSWDLRESELDFPTVTRSSEVLVRYERLERHSHGDPILYATAIERPPSWLPSTGPVPTLRLSDSDVKENRGAGLASLHYNHQVGPLEQRRLRLRNESAEVIGCRFSNNGRAALLVESPFHEIRTAPLANITYSLNSSDVDANEMGVVVQNSQDVSASNNLFHWLVAHNRFRENRRGGVDLTLPYAWRYDRRTTHSALLENNTFVDNHNFAMVVDGHFAVVEARFNRFSNNGCLRGLMLVKGMEKEILIEDNIMDRNRCAYVVEFHADSHTEKFGRVLATFRKNRLRSNRYGTNETGTSSPAYQPRSYTVGLRGVQKVDVTNNVFSDNALDYELLAGIESGSLATRVNVRENWWGTTDARRIRRRIFDFDDWNSFAVAEFSPYTMNEEIYGFTVEEYRNVSYVDVEQLGGRLYNSTILRRRQRPYVVRSDLTVMPGATLQIEDGVELQFFPSIGILVLGALRALGREDRPIVMRPWTRDGYAGRRRRQMPSPQSPADVRLCTGGNCSGRTGQGFVELRNATHLQWAPLCDPYFTEDNAAVVCREMGRDAPNVHFRHGTRLDLDANLLSRLAHWPEPRQCDGNERRFLDCPLRFGGFYRPTYPCDVDGPFVFVYCGPSVLPSGSGHWGGIRFAAPTFEPPETPSYDAAPSTVLVDQSVLEYVSIVGAGILHNEKSPSVLSVARVPRSFLFVNVTHGASHGVSLLAPTTTSVIYGSRIEDNLGTGISVDVLYGESRDSATSSFAPLLEVAIPYKTFGLVDVCSSDKVLPVQNRLLVYYKYDHNVADCVKIFTSGSGLRTLGFRFLQLHLLDTRHLSPIPDGVGLFDGDLYGPTPPSRLALVTAYSGDERRFFKTQSRSLTVRLHASGGSERLGFVAEVVAIPTATSVRRDVRHNVTRCIVARNVLGGLRYASVGEVGPAVSVLHSSFKDNGVDLFGNFSTSTVAVDLDVQNTLQVFVQNNMLEENQGGLRIVADSETSAASTNAFIANNLFYRNRKWEVIDVRGRKTTPFQMVDVFKNVVTRNEARYRDAMHFERVVVNFTGNFVANNTGDHVVTMVAFDQFSRPDFQVIAHNHFWDNRAVRRDERSTVVLVGAGQRIEENVLLDPYNDFEVMVRNLSRTPPYEWPRLARIDGTNNWWGYNQSTAVSGRIWDGVDEPGVAEVVYRPFYLRNDTLLSGKCPPGWLLIGKTCFVYVGGVMEFDDAELYCQSINGSIPYVERSNVWDVLPFVSRQQVNYDPRTQSVWVRTVDTPLRGCSALRGARTYATRCDEALPVLCETDPDVYLDPGDWTKYDVTFATIGAVAAALLVVLLCVLFWLCKSRRRHLEKLERRNSIRSSIRSASSRSLGGSATFGSADLVYRRKMLGEDRPSDVKPVQLTEVKPVNGSVDSIAKSAGSRFDSSQLDSSADDVRSYDVFEAKNHHVEYSDFEDKYETETGDPLRPGGAPDDDYDLDDTRTTQTPSSSIGYGFDNKCYLETHFTSEETASASTVSSTLDEPADVKMALETAGGYESRSTPSSVSQDYYQRQPLETEM